MKNNDFDYIKEKFDNDKISSPESLSEENIKAKLEKGTKVSNVIKFKPNNKRFVKSAVSIAAAIALVVVSISAVNHFSSKVTDNESTITTSNDDIIYFSSREEIDKLMKERLETEKSGSGLLVKNFEKSAEDAEVASDGSSGKMNYGKSVGAGSGASHSDTYKQVDTVDEADIVKTDGKYIYYLSGCEREIVIVSAENGKTKKASRIKLNDDSEPRDIFVKDNTLVLIASGIRYTDKKEYEYKTITTVKAYDIKDRSNPKEKYSYSQSGYYNSSRMIGDCVYIISNETNFYYVKNRIYPCATDKDGEFKEISPGNICAIREGKGGNYTVIGALDVSNGNKKKTKAVIGATDEIYCSENNLYITGINYDFNSYTFNSECTIVKISLDKTNINIKATGRVKGNVNDQYSMDEKDGYFRIATTKQTQKGNDINVLYVLDEKLNEVGRVNSFAKNEHIEAVKYIGDMAYVITYEQTDPLFIIDLSDPENPDILGEVKISGFSTMLVPVDEKTLLGIGYSTEENEFGEATNGLKLALFDISNPAKPKVIGEKEFEGVDSEVQYEPKALVVNSEKNYYAIPATFDDYESQGALVFSVKNGKIKMLKEFKSDRLIESDRCLYIDDDIYVLDTYEEIIDSFTIN